jgi:hypothetical protein
MVDFAKLKKGSSIEKLTKALESQNKFARDERYWQPAVDKAGNGYALIRFLDSPAVDGDDAEPWVTMFSHSFKGPNGQWYIENSLTTLNGQKDPVSEYNQMLWNTGLEENKKRVSEQKRRLSYISNILVVSDPAHPENNGKVFLYQYGKKIMDKIKDKLGIGTADDSEFVDPDEVKFNPFNFWEGANFKLKIRKVEGFRNYDKSEFDKQSALFDDDKKIEALWKTEYSLKAEVAPSKFKKYEELESKLNTVMGLTGSSGTAASKASSSAAPAKARKTAEQVVDDEPVPSASEADAEIKAATTSTPDEDDEFAAFSKLANS